jgi:hypothetical protein
MQVYVQRILSKLIGNNQWIQIWWEHDNLGMILDVDKSGACTLSVMSANTASSAVARSTHGRKDWQMIFNTPGANKHCHLGRTLQYVCFRFHPQKQLVAMTVCRIFCLCIKTNIRTQ